MITQTAVKLLEFTLGFTLIGIPLVLAVYNWIELKWGEVYDLLLITGIGLTFATAWSWASPASSWTIILAGAAIGAAAVVIGLEPVRKQKEVLTK